MDILTDLDEAIARIVADLGGVSVPALSSEVGHRLIDPTLAALAMNRLADPVCV